MPRMIIIMFINAGLLVTMLSSEVMMSIKCKQIFTNHCSPVKDYLRKKLFEQEINENGF